MSRLTVFWIALALALATLVVPWLVPTGPSSALDASSHLQTGSLGVAGLVIFAGGLLTALTPCVYPLIPITVSVFGARQAQSRARATVLTSSYVIGMGLVFSVLGVIAALTGKVFGSALGNIWVAGGLALFLTLLAASMFGAFELALPSSWATRLNSVGGGGVVGALLMGSVAGLLAAPCTGPVLTGVLTYVAQSQNPGLGGALLFIYALGIGVPFFLIGVFTIRLPKSGVWMEWVKSVFGIALLALAVAYIRDASPAFRELVSRLGAELGRVPGSVVAALIVFVAVVIGALHRSFKSDARDFAFKTVAVGLAVFAILVRGAATNAPATGALWVRLNLVPEPPKSEGLVWHLTFPGKNVSSVSEFDAALEQAKSTGKPVMIDFFAEWCEACKELDRETYVAPEVVDESKRFINIKVDATNGEDSVEELYQRYRVQGLPTVVFVDSNGKVLDDPRVIGFVDAKEFLDAQRKVRCATSSC